MNVALDEYMRNRKHGSMMRTSVSDDYAASGGFASMLSESSDDDDEKCLIPRHMVDGSCQDLLVSPSNKSAVLEEEAAAGVLPEGSLSTSDSMTGREDEYERLIAGQKGGGHELIFENAVMAKKEETGFAIASQVFFPFLVAGVGMVCAGLLLDVVQHWHVFKDLSEIFVMVPALLGLKGNLEMTLAARLSTQANLGNMDSRSDQWTLAVSNLALIQCQALVVAFLASVAAVFLGWMPTGTYNLHHGLVLCASALITASLASFILGVIMVFVIIFSRKWGINPDNVATPIAASLGDLTTLALLALAARVLYTESSRWIAPAVIGGFLITTPLWIYIARKTPQTKVVLVTGWIPVICAMLISSIGGMILGVAVGVYKGIAVFQPVINGAGGNLAAVQASRLSTYLHTHCPFGQLPSWCRNTVWISPWRLLTEPGTEAVTVRVLLGFVVPSHIIFAMVIALCNAGHTSITPIFLVSYLSAALVQVMLLLYSGHVLVHWMWKRSIDPDNSAIPYLTALGDLLGTGFLALAFHLLYVCGLRDEGKAVVVH